MELFRYIVSVAHPNRTTFAGEIITEFLAPERPSNKVVIFCDGMPGMPGNSKAQQHAAKRGYWSFFPRYRGTWESGGEFLSQSPTQDILDVVSSIQSGPFVDAWTGEEHTIEDPEFYVIGVSFGGPAAILSSLDPRVKKAVSISGVVDWVEEEKSPDEPMSWLGPTVKKSFGKAYRFSDENWERLCRGEIYNPVNHKSELDASKVLLLHTKDDLVVLYEPVKEFADEVGCRLVTFKKGGHIGTAAVRKLFRRHHIWNFLKD